MNGRFDANVRAIALIDAGLADDLAALAPTPRITSSATPDGGGVITVAAPGGQARLTLPDLSPDVIDDRADELASSRMTVVTGFGSGRLLAETLRHTGPDGFVLLVEPDIDLFAATLAFIDITPLVADDRLALAIGLNPRDAIIGQAEKRYGVTTVKGVARIETPGVRALYGDYFAQIDREVEQLLSFAEQNRIALTEQGLLWRTNILQNLAAIVDAGPVSTLFDTGQGGAAILISAGPSLDRTMPMIAAAKGRIPLIAVDTALRPLARAGVAPDIVVCVDANEVNLNHLADIDLSDTIMVLHPAVYPEIARLPCKERLFFGGPDPLFGFIERTVGPRGDLLTGGTVAASVFDLAVKMGLSPLILCGQDLSFTDNASHASGAVFQQEKSALFVGDARPVNDLFGRSVKSNTKMLAWKNWFEIAIAQNRVTAYNATEGGLVIDGAPNVSLGEMVARYGALPMPVIMGRPDAAGSEELANELHAALTETRQVKSVCGRGVAAVKKNAPMTELAALAQQTLANERFVEINRYWVDEALDEIDTIQRSLRSATHGRKEALTREAWRRLFERLYETATGFDRELGNAIKTLHAGRAA